MSLKGFHIFFILVSILLSIGCAVWAFVSGAETAFGVACVIAAVALFIYGIFFIRKTRKLIV